MRVTTDTDPSGMPECILRIGCCMASPAKMRSAIACLALLLVPLAHAVKLPKLSAEEIEDHSAAAMYPSEQREESLNTIIIRGHIVGPSGMTEFDTLWKWKAPNKWYRQVQRSREQYYESAFDGQTTWARLRGHRAHLLDEKDTAIAREFNALDRLTRWRTYLDKVEYDGTYRLGDVDVYRVRETHRDGKVHTVYFDGTTFVRVRDDWVDTETGRPTYCRDYFLDYRRGHGLTMAFHIRRIIRHDSPLSEDARQVDFLVDDIQLNQPIDDSLFAPPPELLQAITPHAESR